MRLVKYVILLIISISFFSCVRSTINDTSSQDEIVKSYINNLITNDFLSNYEMLDSVAKSMTDFSSFKIKCEQEKQILSKHGNDFVHKENWLDYKEQTRFYNFIYETQSDSLKHTDLIAKFIFIYPEMEIRSVEIIDYSTDK